MKTARTGTERPAAGASGRHRPRGGGRILLVALISTGFLGTAGALTAAYPATSASASASTSASSCRTSRPLLSEGDRGGCVAFLQTTLTGNGFSTTADGVFGPRTLASVKSFQYACGFRGSAVDGIVGPRTWAGLLDHACV